MIKPPKTAVTRVDFRRHKPIITGDKRFDRAMDKGVNQSENKKKNYEISSQELNF